MDKRWKILAALSLARVAMGFQFQAIGASASFVQARYGLDLAGIGFLVGLYLMPGMVMALPSGVLGARFGDKRMASIGLVLMSIGGAVCALAPDAATFTAGRAIAGVGGVTFNVLVTKMVADWFAGRELVLAMSIVINTWPIGIGLALFVLGPVAAAAGVGAAFGTVAAACLVSLALLVVFYQPPPGAAVVSRPSLRAISAREWRLLALSGLAWMLFNVMYAGLANFLPVYFIERGVSVAQAGALTATNTLLVVFAVPAGGYLTQRTGKPFAVLALSLVGGSLALAALLVTGESARLALLVACGFLYGLAAGIIVAMPGQFLRPETRATGMGVFLTVFYVGMGVLPGVLGLASSRYGTAEAALVLCIGMSIASLGFVAWARVLQRAPG